MVKCCGIQSTNNMNPELEKQLIKDYPILFKFHGGDPKETCMACGCEHDDGWWKTLCPKCAVNQWRDDSHIGELL